MDLAFSGTYARLYMLWVEQEKAGKLFLEGISAFGDVVRTSMGHSDWILLMLHSNPRHQISGFDV